MTIRPSTWTIGELLDLPAWRALDVDDEGRVLAGHDASGTMQLVELAADGTATPLTALPGSCSGRYLPGARTVVVQHDQSGNENMQLSLLPLDPPPAAPVGLDGLIALVRDERFFHNLIEVDAGRVVYATNRRNAVDMDVVVHEVATGAETVVYDGGGAVGEAAVAPGGFAAVVAVDSALAMSQQLLLADGSARATRALTDAATHAQHAHPQWLPGGTSLLVTTDRDRDFTVLARFDPADGGWTEVVAREGMDVTGWVSPDGRLILAMANDDGSARLSLHDAATGAKLRDVALPQEGWTGDHPVPAPVWSPDGHFVVLSYTAPAVPGDVLRIEAATGEVVTLATSGGPLEGRPVVLPTMHRLPTPDGELVPCFVYRGVGESGSALAGSAGAGSAGAGSAVVLIHGGPEGQSVRAFNPVIQSLAAAGHTVLVPNVRGSVGYGKRWYSADDKRLRLDSVADLAALHAWLPELGVDPARAALWGGSYGGYMVLAGVAFQPELWAAGVDIVGISSLVSFLENTSSYRRASREREYGTLAEDREFLASASALSRIDDIRAPLFVIHGANDPRVPLSEAEQLTAALRKNGVECELLVYGDEGHGLAKRVNRLDAYPRALDFLARLLAKPV